jgi:hypothetical protein
VGPIFHRRILFRQSSSDGSRGANIGSRNTVGKITLIPQAWPANVTLGSIHRHPSGGVK